MRPIRDTFRQIIRRHTNQRPLPRTLANGLLFATLSGLQYGRPDNLEEPFEMPREVPKLNPYLLTAMY